MMQSMTGAFRRGPDANEDVRPWSCPLCSTVNSKVMDESPPRCMMCKRLRYPPWLCLEDSGVQITLDSCVFHTSAGGSKSVSVVVAIDYVLKGVTLLRAKVKRSDGGDLTFHEVVLNALQIQQQLEPLDAEQEEDCVLDNYGICGECRGVFRVAQGDRQSQYANEDKVSVLETELQQLGEQKLRLVRDKAYERVLRRNQAQNEAASGLPARLGVSHSRLLSILWVDGYLLRFSKLTNRSTRKKGNDNLFGAPF